MAHLSTLYVRWRCVSYVQFEHDGQDSAVVPSRGWRALARTRHVVAAPEAPGVVRTNDGVIQADAEWSSFWTVRRRGRLFGVAAAGTSFDGTPLPTEQFTTGRPFHLDAFSVGEHRGDHMWVGTVGYLHQIGRLPDFLGGAVFAGGWLENGSTFDTGTDVDVHTHGGAGIVLDTLVGPVLAGAGAGFDGGWRTFFGVGRIF